MLCTNTAAASACTNLVHDNSCARYAAALSDYRPYLFLKRSTRPPVSTNFCLPVKNGWHFEHISTFNSGLTEPLSNVSPHAQCTTHLSYAGWMPSFTAFHLFIMRNYRSLSREHNPRTFLKHAQPAAALAVTAAEDIIPYPNVIATTFYSVLARF